MSDAEKSIIEDLYVPQEEWNEREAERYAAKHPQVHAKPKAALQPTIPVGERDPFVILQTALADPNGKEIIKAIVRELGKQRAANWDQGSVRLALETARRVAPQPAGMKGDFRIDNRVAPAIARYILTVKPELRGWLELRRMDGEEADVAAAYSDPNLPMPYDWRLLWVDPEHPYDPMPFKDPAVL